MFSKYVVMSRKAKKVAARRFYILGWPLDAICKKLWISRRTLDDWTKGA